jgi:hypothetical protein
VVAFTASPVGAAATAAEEAADVDAIPQHGGDTTIDDATIVSQHEACRQTSLPQQS